MSISISYQPVNPMPLPFDCPSTFLEALKRAIGDKIDCLEMQHVDVLRGIQAASPRNDSEAVGKLIEAIRAQSRVLIFVTS